MTPVDPLPRVAPAHLAIALAAAFLTGGLIAVQSRINGELGDRLGDGFVAAVVSFGSGLVILSLALLVSRRGRDGIRRVLTTIRARQIPWWLAFGGLGGGIFVLGQGLTVATLGVALFTVGVVCGQTVSSLVVDHRGIALAPPRPVTPRRALGAALAVVAVVVAVGDRIRPDAPWLTLVTPLVAGVLVGWQLAVNGQIRQVSGSALTATFGNFLVGTAVLIVALGIHLAIAGWHVDWPSEPWLYAGGAIGCVFIAAQAVIVRWTGVLLMGLALIAGQLAGSVLLDAVTPLGHTEVHLVTVIGTALVLVAVVVASWPARPASTQR